MSPSLKLNFVPLLLVLGFAGITSATPFFFNNLLVSTVSLTQTVTETTTTKVVCAELVNVTNACNARNGRWLRVPEILTFDDGLEVIDHYINPSVPYRIVPTIFHEEMPRTPFLESGHVNVYNPEPIQARIFFGQLLNNIGATVTRQFTVTTTETSSVLGTFFISGCTPSPFPFNLC